MADVKQESAAREPEVNSGVATRAKGIGYKLSEKGKCQIDKRVRNQ